MEDLRCFFCGGSGEVFYQRDDDTPSEVRVCESCKGNGFERLSTFRAKREFNLGDETAMDRAVEALENAFVKLGVFKK